MNQILSLLRLQWQRYSQRERRLITLAATVVLLGLLLGLTDALLTERKRLDKQLAASQQEMGRVIGIAKVLESLSSNATVPQVPLENMARNLASEAEKHGMALHVEKQGENLHVEGEADQKAILSLIATIQGETGWRAISLAFTPAARGTHVELILESPKW